MKFQNPSLNFFLNRRKDARTHKPKPICSPLFQSWGHKNIGGKMGRIQNGDFDIEAGQLALFPSWPLSQLGPGSTRPGLFSLLFYNEG